MKRRKRVAAKVAATRLITPTGVEPVKIVTPFLKLIFCAGKLSDVLYVPPWRMLISVCESKGKSPLDCSPPTEVSGGRVLTNLNKVITLWALLLNNSEFSEL